MTFLKFRSPTPENAAASEARPSNPYFDGRQQWSDLYDNIARQRDRWMYGCAALVVALILSPLVTAHVIRAGAEPPPYVALVDRSTGEPISGTVAAAADVNDPVVLKHELWEFISSMRLVTTDRQFQQQAVRRAYGYLPEGGAAYRTVTDWYRAHDPFQRSAQVTVTPSLLVILPQTRDTWSIEWTEVERDAQTGEVQSNHHYKALVTIARKPAGGAEHVAINPLQVFVTSFAADLVQ